VANGYDEVPITSDHALAVDHLPPHHRDPFDRMLIAQARAEGLQLVTADAQVVQYGNGILPA
jgi:PIN domain nuclease of toxin-antitoxin system